MPRRNANPYDVSQDPEGNIWVADVGGSAASLFKFNPRDQSFTLYPKPQKTADTPKVQITKDGAIWVRTAREPGCAGVRRALPRHGQDHRARRVLYERIAGISVQGWSRRRERSSEASHETARRSSPWLCVSVPLDSATCNLIATATRRIHAQAPKIAPMHVHHVHLNSVNPAAAAAYYPKPFAATATKTTFNGYEAVKTGNVYHAVHEGRRAAAERADRARRRRSGTSAGTRPTRANATSASAPWVSTIAQMWDAADGKLVDMSSDTLPGLPTQEQILEMRAKGVAADAGRAASAICADPTASMIENAQAGDVERFNHMHMYHEHPLCAMQWYVTHLGATLPQGRGGAAALPPASGDCKQPYAPPTWPSFAKFPASSAIHPAPSSSTTFRFPSDRGLAAAWSARAGTSSITGR